MNDSGAGAGADREARNDSFHVSGGTFNGPVAYGYQAHATQLARDVEAAPDLARLEQALGELAAGLRAMGGAGADDALEDLDRVHEELGRHQPDRSRMAQLMDRITAVITPVGGLLDLADHVRELITAVVH